MSKVAITEQYLTDIADAIRTKTGLSDSYFPSEMASAILTISGSGGITPAGTISITENGTYNVTSYASADVSVPTGSSINNQNKSVEPRESEQSITADSGYTGLGTVTIGAISSTYVGSEITRRDNDDLVGALNTSTYDVTVPAGYYASNGTFSITKKSSDNLTASVIAGYLRVNVQEGYYVTSGKPIIQVKTSDNLTVSGATVTVPEGYYEEAASKSVTTMTLPTSASASATFGYTSKATIGRSTSDQYINIPTGYNSAGGYYKISAVANGSVSTPIASKGAVNNHAISVTPSVTSTTGYITGSTVNGTAIIVSASELVSGTLSITSNGIKDVTNYASIDVSVPTGGTINNQNKTVTPSASQQIITADSGYTGLGTVTISAPPTASFYVDREYEYTTEEGSGKLICKITPYVDLNTEYGDVEGWIANGTHQEGGPLSFPAIESGIVITPTESLQYIGETDCVMRGQLTISAIPSNYIGSGITQRSSTDLTVSGATVTAPAGYYESAASKSVATMTLPTSAASSATSGYTSKATIGRSTSDQYINIAPGYNSAGGYYKISAVANGSATPAASISGTSATITTGTNTITLTKSVSNTPQVTAGYVSSGTAGNSSVSLTASVTVNPTPTASGATVTIPAGYYNSQKTKSVSSGSASAPTSISGTTATVSTGTNTLTLTKTVSVTPVVSAGYVSSGTATNSSVSLTASVTTKAAATITPGTTDQTIASGTYLTGTQTIAGDEDLVASNIVNGVQIFGVTGNVVLQNYYTGSSAPSSSLGQNGDIYIQQ